MPTLTVTAYANGSRDTGSGGSVWNLPSLPGAAGTTFADYVPATNDSISTSDSQSLDQTAFRNVATNAPVDWAGKTITFFELTILGALQGTNPNVAIIFAENGNLANNFQLPAAATPYPPDGQFYDWFYAYSYIGGGGGGGSWAEFVRDLLVADKLLISLINNPQGLVTLQIDQVKLRVDYTEVVPPATTPGFAMEF